MAKQEYEFTLILSGVRELTRAVLDSLYQAGTDDALIGMRDGVAYAEFCREADSFEEAVISAKRNVESADIGAKVEHIEPDELVTVSEIARQLHQSREGVRKRVAGLRGPGKFPPPIGSLTRRSPLWRWTDVIRWHQLQSETTNFQEAASEEKKRATKKTTKQKRAGRAMDMHVLMNLGSPIAAFNAALELRRRVPLEKAIQLLQTIAAKETSASRPHQA